MESLYKYRKNYFEGKVGFKLGNSNFYRSDQISFTNPSFTIYNAKD